MRTTRLDTATIEAPLADVLIIPAPLADDPGRLRVIVAPQAWHESRRDRAARIEQTPIAPSAPAPQASPQARQFPHEPKAGFTITADGKLERFDPHAPRPRKGPGLADTPCPTAKIYSRASCYTIPPAGDFAGIRYQPVTYATCKLPTCPACEERRADKLRARWKPAIERFNNPVAITLTIENGDTAKERRRALTAALGRLADLRIGTRGRAKLQARALRFIDSLDPEALKRSGRTADDWRELVASWMEYAARRELKLRESGKRLRFRDMMRGILTMESTNRGRGWHFHLHGILDMRRFLPWPVLVAAWTTATKQDKSAGAHISKIDGDPTGEAFKYAAKPTDMAGLSKDQRQELIDALYNCKRVFIFGGLHPTEPEPEPCPCCGSTTCAHERVAIATRDDQPQDGQDFLTRTETTARFGHTARPVVEYADPKLKRRIWAVVIDADEPRMARQFPNVNTSARGFDATAPPTAPPGMAREAYTP